MNYTEDQKNLISQYSDTDLSKLPESTIPFWICSCGKILDSKNDVCPDCSATNHRPMCPLDTLDVPTTIEASISTCPICGNFIHPVNGSHDILVKSRVTGYLGDVTNFNAGKQDELKRRQRINL